MKKTKKTFVTCNNVDDITSNLLSTVHCNVFCIYQCLSYIAKLTYDGPTVRFDS